MTDPPDPAADPYEPPDPEDAVSELRCCLLLLLRLLLLRDEAKSESADSNPRAPARANLAGAAGVAV